MYTRNCPACDKEIKYSNESNLKRATKGEKICKTCAVKLRNNDAAYLKKISDSRKKYFSELSEKDKEAWKSNNSKAQKEVWKNKSDEAREKHIKNIGEQTKKKMECPGLYRKSFKIYERKLMD